MPTTDHLEQENIETTPLISSKNLPLSLTKRKKSELIPRILGRVFNPPNDMAVGSIILISFNPFFAPIGYDEIPNNYHIPLWIILGLIGTSSIGFEIINSLKLNKHSRFILGENYYEHTKIFIQELTSLPDNQSQQDSQLPFERWLVELKESTDQESIKSLIKNFETVNRYNYIRKFIDNISTLILEVNVYQTLLSTLWFYDPTENNSCFFFPNLTAITVLILIKMRIDRIEDKWLLYQNSWENMSLSGKKKFLAFRTSIEALYHCILGTTAMSLFFNTGYTFIITPFQLEDNKLGTAYFRFEELYILLLSIPFAVIYTATQLISEQRCYPRLKNCRNIKRATQGIVQAAKTGGLLTALSLMIASIFGFLEFNTSNSNLLVAFIFAGIIPLISSAVTLVNTILNYQDPDPNKMSTVVHDVSKLRKEIVDIKERLLEEAGHKDHDNIDTDMHDKSEIDPTPDDALLENTQRNNNRSFLSSLCCFWGQSNSNEDTARSHSSSNLREAIDFQKT